VAAGDHPVTKQKFGQRIDGADMDGEQFVTGTIDWTNVQHHFDDFVGAAVVPNRIPFERLDHCSHKTRTSSDDHAADSAVASLLGIGPRDDQGGVEKRCYVLR